LNFIPPQQVLFGTDFPYRGTREQVTALQSMGLKPPVLRGILSGNARRLLGA
jgi:predicted TIM-barrel fold metal-dependent hydrolase